MNDETITPHFDLNPINYSRIVAQLLGLNKSKISQLLVGTTLSTEQFIHDNELVHEADQFQIYKNALAISDDPSFGLRLGRYLTPPTHGSMGFLANCSPTLLSAIENFSQFLPTRLSCGSLDIKIDSEWTECSFTIHTELDFEVYRFTLEALSLAFISLAEYIVGRPLTEIKAEFSYKKPRYHAKYHDHFGCEVTFDKTRNTLKIPTSITHIPNISCDHTTYNLALMQCSKTLNKLNTEKNTFAYQVKKVILSKPDAHRSEEAVSAELFMSKRTLARRLKLENTSFRVIRDDVLASLAKGYLLETSLSVDSIANLLGYHDSSSFRKFFKRIYDAPPNAFRISYKQDI